MMLIEGFVAAKGRRDGSDLGHQDRKKNAEV
jgi:hypothetical protein